jgi:hypothetical protein
MWSGSWSDIVRTLVVGAVPSGTLVLLLRVSGTLP